MHACVFCESSWPSIESLVKHLVIVHRAVDIDIGDQTTSWYTYQTQKGRRVHCFCGQRFTSVLVPPPAPAFLDWALDNIQETNSYCSHLRRERGLAAHLQRLRDEALLHRIATAGTKKAVDPLDCGG